MADSATMGVTCIVFVFYLVNFVTTFNIDTKNPYIYNHGVKNTYFGYSVAFNSDTGSIIVGAPFSNDTNEGNKPWGSVFSCAYNEDKAQRTCKKLPKVDQLKFGGEIKDNQMMGATVYSDNYRTMACAPRYKTISNDGNNFIWMQGKCDVIYPERHVDDDWTWRPCVGITSRLQEFGYCEAGFSTKFNSVDRDVGIISGMPRAQLSKGLLAIYSDGQGTKFTDETRLNISDYLGYSVGSGKLANDSSESIVGGAPRANLLTGAVIIYQVTTRGFPIKFSITDPENKPGSYFGSSLVVTNIDNDENNLDDLVVGAPYYSSGQSPNEGAVYVYLNSGGSEGVILRQRIYGDKEKNACFGYSIGSVGDLNKDANNDIVIGAPWGGPEGRGVVYIYYGAPSKHQPLIFKQKLVPSELGGDAAQLNGFGYSFAEYYPYKVQDDIMGTTHNDVDGNRYPDLGIGAYKSDSVVIFRSRPVITIIGTLSLGGTKKIDLYDVNPTTMCAAPDGKKYKCVKVKVAFLLTGIGIGSDGTDVSYTIDVDAYQKVSKRGFFLANKGDKKAHTLTNTINVKDSREERHHTLYLVNNTKDLVREMVILLKWDIKESGSCSANNKICPVTNQMVNALTIKKLPYITGCSDDGNDECNTDLKLTMTKSLPSGGDTIQSGITTLIDIHVKIENKRENAFLNKLLIEYPTGIQPNKVVIVNFPGVEIWDPNASLNEDKNTLEVILSNPIYQKSIEKVNIQFGVSSLTSKLKTVTLKAKVITGSVEMAPADNKAEISIDVVLVANLTITGRVNPELVKWRKDAKDSTVRGEELEHLLLLQNRGPSGVDTSDVVIKFPEKFDSHYILNIIDIKLEGTNKLDQNLGTCNCGGKLNPVGVNGTFTSSHCKNTSVSTRRRREVQYESLGCGGDKISCRTIICSLKYLKKSDYVQVKIKSTLVDASFENYVKGTKKIGVNAKFTSKTVDKPAQDAAKDNVDVYLTVLTPHGTYTAESKPLAWWIILICVLAALLIIVVVCIILYKKKFFERNRPPSEEEEDLKNGDLDDDDE